MPWMKTALNQKNTYRVKKANTSFNMTFKKQQAKYLQKAIKKHEH